jgi:hypothetical protein
MKDILTLSEVAKIFNTNEAYILGLAHRKILPCRKIKDKYLFRKQQISNIESNIKKVRNSVVFTGEESIEEVITHLNYPLGERFKDFIRYYSFYVISILLVLFGFYLIFGQQ